MDDRFESELPEFEKRPYTRVMTFVSGVLGNALMKLITYPDGHFRVVFRESYFALPEGETEPSKSQWSTLKKRFKRRDHRTFIFKQHGTMDCRQVGGDVVLAQGERCYYLDLGFFLYE